MYMLDVSVSFRVCAMYMGEDPENLMREYVGMDEGALSEAIKDTTIGIYILKEEASSDEPDDIGVILEGISV